MFVLCSRVSGNNAEVGWVSAACSGNIHRRSASIVRWWWLFFGLNEGDTLHDR